MPLFPIGDDSHPPVLRSRTDADASAAFEAMQGVLERRRTGLEAVAQGAGLIADTDAIDALSFAGLGDGAGLDAVRALARSLTDQVSLAETRLALAQIAQPPVAPVPRPAPAPRSDPRPAPQARCAPSPAIAAAQSGAVSTAASVRVGPSMPLTLAGPPLPSPPRCRSPGWRVTRGRFHSGALPLPAGC